MQKTRENVTNVQVINKSLRMEIFENLESIAFLTCRQYFSSVDFILPNSEETIFPTLCCVPIWCWTLSSWPECSGCLSLVRSLNQQSSEVSNHAKWNESMLNCLEFHQGLSADFFGAEEFIASWWAAAGKSEIFRFLISELGEMQKFGETALKYLFSTDVSQH